ncbi:MAG TPA: hypothetical protein VFN67_12310 [Polyangiales bacterium]|nr:hypothetical protein [Polyangiales bacterium]
MHLGVSHRHNLAACIALLLSACSHAVESPKPALSKTKPIEPDLVCNAQIESAVVIRGSGLTPAPVDTLSEPTQLWLPSITLTRHADLEGNSADETRVQISGRPGELKKHADHNSWQSAKQMTLYVDESLELAPGLYDLQVENPDGASRVDAKRALAVVPPPELTELRPPSICVDQSDIELTLIGKNFLRYGDALPKVAIATKDGDALKTYDVMALNGCSDVPDRTQDAKLCTDAVFKVPEDDLDPGTYRVVLTNPAPAGCSSTEALEVKVNPPPKVNAVVPASVCSGGSILVASGQDFSSGATAELRCTGGATLEASSVEVSGDGNTATMMFGAGAVAGENCDVVVRNPDGCEDRPLPHRTVVGTEGPILFYTAPPVVFNGITTQVKLFVTALMPPFTVSIRLSDGGDKIDLTAIQDPANGRRLQASVPAGTAPGEYDVMVADATSCNAVLTRGLTVTDKQSIELSEIQPTFGQSTVAQAVTIIRKGGDAFAPTPMVFLSPKGSDAPAVQLDGVSVVNDDTSTAVVPPQTPKGTYNLVVVDPKSGSVGVLEDAYVSTQDAPPVVDEVTPQSIINATAQALTIRGASFTSATVSLTCKAPGSSSTQTPSVNTSTQSCANTNQCQVSASVDGSGLTEGSVCVVRVRNADGSYFDFSAIGVTNSSENLAQSRSGTKLQTARRALSAAAVKATAASRFVYAIGGDTGPANAGSPLTSVELAPVDIFGNMSAWQTNPHPLPAARSSAASAVIGRYIYVYGGSDGTNALSSGVRALVLSPRETPVLQDLDLCLSDTEVECFGQKGRPGLQAGTYAYRVAAVIDDSDAVNLGGETLASDPLSLSLPDINGRGIVVKLIWSKPVDSQHAAISGVTGYRIYRTPRGGAAGSDEVLLATVDASATQFLDDGSRTLGEDKPLAPGSTSAWQALPSLNTARNQLRGIAAPDPDTDGAFFLYALLGKDSGSSADNMGNALTSYEYLSVTSQPNGRQSISSWTQPVTGFGAGRFNHGAWLADATVSPHIADGTEYIYVSGGRNGPMNGGLVGGAEAAAIGGDGSLSGFASAHATSTDRAGFGSAAAADRLFVFGGWPSGTIRDSAESLSISAAAPTLETSVNSEGGLNVGGPRFMPGSALQSAFIFVVGGQTTSGGNVTDSTALIVQ